MNVFWQSNEKSKRKIKEKNKYQTKQNEIPKEVKSGKIKRNF